MSKFWDFTAQDPRVVLGGKLDVDFLKAIGHEDTLILGGYLSPDQCSRETNKQTEAVLCSMPNPSASIVIADNAMGEDKSWIDFALKHGVFFWEFEKELFGEVQGSWLQTIGDCVSMGWGRGMNDLLIIDAVNSGGATTFSKENTVATEPAYAGGRVEIGKGRLSGDGSIGSWQAKWGIDYGVILRENHGAGDLDLRTYNGAKARKWGARGNGCPDALEPGAKLHPCSATTKVQTADAATIFLANLNPITIASNQGFTRKRNKDGTCDPSGSWAHQMVLRGVCILSTGKLVYIVQNSWGNYLGSTNNVITTASGRTVELPPGAFAVEAGEMENRILRSGDCWALAGARGWNATAKEVQTVSNFGVAV